jgi:hypothetical protein
MLIYPSNNRTKKIPKLPTFRAKLEKYFSKQIRAVLVIQK